MKSTNASCTFYVTTVRRAHHTPAATSTSGNSNETNLTTDSYNNETNDTTIISLKTKMLIGSNLLLPIRCLVYGAPALPGAGLLLGSSRRYPPLSVDQAGPQVAMNSPISRGPEHGVDKQFELILRPLQYFVP